LIAELEMEDELPGIWQDRGERYGFGDANQCCKVRGQFPLFVLAGRGEDGDSPSRKS
jgi:hypothetical protein